MDISDELLSKVMRYRRGIGKYNFSSLLDSEREIALFDAWNDIENEIDSYLFTKNITIR